MGNEVYTHEGFCEKAHVESGFKQAIKLCKNKNIQNIILVLSHSYLIDAPDNLFSRTISEITSEKLEQIYIKLKKRDYHFENDKIELNVMTTDNFSTQKNNNSIVLLIWATENSIRKLNAAISECTDDIVLCIPSLNHNIKQLLNSYTLIPF
jgi:hypothetical protein